ncbi:MAG: BatA domain-containing protein, partial [Planctomycetota bacterium]
MGFEFGNPAMLIGTLLFSVPLIIHLLNRRRYRVKPWAAMDFLLAAFKRTRRRLRMENFLLLLLRCLIIILLALAMAKPFVASDSAVAALSSIRRDVVVVLDHSYSMGYRLSPDETCYDLARKKIASLLTRLDAARGDTVTMILMGSKPEFVVPYHSSPQEALIKLDRLREPSFLGADFTSLADLLANEVAQQIEGPKEVFIFTDLQARTLSSGQEGEKKSTAALVARAAAQDMEIRFIDVGKPEPCPSNISVVDISTLEPYVTTGAPTTFVATLQNFGDSEIPDGRGAFVLDGTSLETRSFRLGPNAGVSVEISYTVHDPGFHYISFQLEEDRLPYDDQRGYAFDARQSVRILLVEGRPTEESLQSATGELARVINPVLMDGDYDEGTVFKPEVVDYKLFNTNARNVNDYDCIMLADVEGLSAEMADALTNYVQTGGALVLFM